jgi:hypothetical protein
MPKKRDAEIDEADGARADPQAQPGQQLRRSNAAAHLAFNRNGNAFGFFGSPVQQQPARAFGQISPQEKDAEASAAPNPNASRQPMSGGRRPGCSNRLEPIAPSAAPTQKLPLTPRSARPR